MSGLSNVRYWLEEHNIVVSEEVARSILHRAKESKRTLTSDEILEIIRTQP